MQLYMQLSIYTALYMQLSLHAALSTRSSLSLSLSLYTHLSLHCSSTCSLLSLSICPSRPRGNWVSVLGSESLFTLAENPSDSYSRRIVQCRCSFSLCMQLSLYAAIHSAQSVYSVIPICSSLCMQLSLYAALHSAMCIFSSPYVRVSMQLYHAALFGVWHAALRTALYAILYTVLSILRLYMYI